MTPPPLALYVHLPWCVRKCPYCDFNSHALRADEPMPEAAYVRALLLDLDDERERRASAGDQRSIASVFFGGGTPSLFSAHSIGALLDKVAQDFGLARDAEITLEANPGAIEHGRFDALRSAGVNRISLGAQSFDDHALRRLGRVHCAAETHCAVAQVRAAGFTDFNLDLMYALPEQSPAQALLDLETALALEPSHISHYQLTLEPNTLFHHNPPVLPDADDVATMQAACEARLADAGFGQYEVSAYAQPQRASRHNLNYWRFGDYVGIGAGAHGKLTMPGTGRILRTLKTRHPTAYIAAQAGTQGARTERYLSATDLIFEYALNCVRLKQEDLSARDYQRRTGQPASALTAPAGEAVRRGLLTQVGPGHWRKTALGWRFLNDLQAVFLA